MDAQTFNISDPSGPTELTATAARASEVFTSGGLVIFPTETVYGVGAAAGSEAGCRRLREVKERPDQQPFTVHLPSAEAAEWVVDMTQPAVRRALCKLLPGPVTLIAEVDEATMHAKVEALGDPTIGSRLYHEGTVGLRCPDHAGARRILAACPGPVVASSANRRGDPPPHTAEQSAQAIGSMVDLIVDGGPSRFAKPSTIIRIPSDGRWDGIVVEREGVYDKRYIRKLLQYTVLFVCSGNTCRSPMAEALARKFMAARQGVSPAELPDHGVTVLSAGVWAGPGAPASEQAVAAVAQLGGELAGHRSRALTPEMVQQADVIYTMTKDHLDAIVQWDPAVADKTMMLDPSGDVPDPIGAEVSIYVETAKRIASAIETRLGKEPI